MCRADCHFLLKIIEYTCGKRGQCKGWKARRCLQPRWAGEGGKLLGAVHADMGWDWMDIIVHASFVRLINTFTNRYNP